MGLNVHTVTELMAEAALAAGNSNLDRLYDLQRVVEGWVQTKAETDAQLAMLQAFIDLVEFHDFASQN